MILFCVTPDQSYNFHVEEKVVIFRFSGHMIYRVHRGFCNFALWLWEVALFASNKLGPQPILPIAIFIFSSLADATTIPSV